MTKLLDRVTEEAKDAPAPVAELTIELLITAKHNSMAAAAVVRLVRALLVAVSRVESDLVSVVSAPSDLEALLALLNEPSVLEELTRMNPLGPATVRGILKKAEIYEAEGGCISGEEAGRLANVTRQAINDARKKDQVLGLPRGADRWTYPVWQFNEGRYLPGLSDILKILKDHGPFVQASFLLNANSRLNGKRPLDLLRKEDVKPVLKVAKEFGQHGSS